MPKVELVYFDGCPNVEQAREAIRTAGASFEEVKQNPLLGDNPYRGYSSPSVLVDGRLVAGSCNGAAACSITDWAAASRKIRELIAHL